MPLSVVILAAGQGKRMHSDLPKVLQPLGGFTLLEHVVKSAAALDAHAVYVIYGHEGEQVMAAHDHLKVHWVLQDEQLGTGHAVMQALPKISDADLLLVLYGDVPLVTPATLKRLTDAAAKGELAVLTAKVPDPKGYGRILRDGSGRVTRIVEEKDATPAQRWVDEINTGLMACGADRFRRWLKNVGNQNAQKEYYLTDVIAMAVADGVKVEGVLAEDHNETRGINDKQQLAQAEKALRKRTAIELMLAGLTLRDPRRFDLRGSIEFGRDTVIDVNCVLEGRVKLGDRVKIGPQVLIRDCEIGDDTEVLAQCVLDGAKIGAKVRIGPFARIRPGTALADEAHVGNFVEVKNSRFGKGSKANHLAYVGDAKVGDQVNIGAGVITCNYDGAAKHTTVIEDGAFVGSDVTLVAPVTVGAGAYIAAGSTITKNAPAGQLTLARARQETKAGWQPPVKKK
ncbi:MAG TPA: bifunctional UDP-N-acetylglucosamine diphosphorylase/glucosamine-1-phosphate N-acetyltransferase GlmU [Gammaproteobacteria bacterium]|nr:bifunctional UDP-N-acetylglucosamine diphosphorylase/glucosamine-1-phosphate N-acetyltransferase GlmU [Gammaproteobacteria bacterium]